MADTQPKIKRERIQQAYKFAIDPTPAQERQLYSHAGGARFVYNWALAKIAESLDEYAAQKAAGVKPTAKRLGHKDLCPLWTAHKNAHADGDLHWVPQNSVNTYQAAIRDADVAWTNFFKSRSGERKGRRMGRPKFKSRHRSKIAFQMHGTGLGVCGPRRIRLPKIGEVRVAEPTRKLRRHLERGSGRIVRASVSRTPAGRWYASLTVEVEREIRTAPTRRQAAGGIIGIDFGVRDLATLSTGDRIDNPRYLAAAQAKLAAAQRTLSRRQSGSARRERARRRVAALHERVANLRHDALSKLASGLVHGHSVVVVEGWDVADTLRHGSAGLPRKIRNQRNLALADTGIGKARWMLESRSAWYGATTVVLDRHHPTGRTCSACGQVRAKPVPPAQEHFTCPACGLTMDRRLNTARVLATAGARPSDAPSGGESQNARGGDVRPGAARRTGQPPPKRVARTRRPRRGQTGAPGP